MIKPILNFSGDYAFLSNFYPSPIKYDGIKYPTVEHGFQAFKSIDLEERYYIASLRTPGQAKRAGRIVRLRKDWEDIKEDVMLDLLRLKFKKSSALAKKLKNTGNATLIEGNTWNDTYWGMCRGVGKNRLGVLLMQVRDELNGCT